MSQLLISHISLYFRLHQEERRVSVFRNTFSVSSVRTRQTLRPVFGRNSGKKEVQVAAWEVEVVSRIFRCKVSGSHFIASSSHSKCLNFCVFFFFSLSCLFHEPPEIYAKFNSLKDFSFEGYTGVIFILNVFDPPKSKSYRHSRFSVLTLQYQQI